MNGYRVSQMSAVEAAHVGLDIWISPELGFFIQANYDQARKFLRSPIERMEIPDDAFKAIIGVHLDPLEMSIAELSQAMDLSYNSLVKAAREGRLEARQTGSIWLSTERAVNEAIGAGRLRPRK